ncbi:MAG: amidohydrolase family protein [Chthoniobacterales bacterium]
MILRARVVVTMDGEPIENGAVAVRGSRISHVGRFADVRRHAAGPLLDLGEVALMPGLINAHCHLDYTLLRGAIAPTNFFADWIEAINLAKASLTSTDYLAAIAAGFDQARRYGTTAIANFEAFPDLLASIAGSPLRVWWFPEMIDIRTPVNVAEIVDRAFEYLSRAGPRGGLGLAPHSLYTASPALFAQAAEIARRDGLLLSTHLAESRDEMAMFRSASGPLFEMMRRFNREPDDCGRATPLARFLQQVRVGKDWIIAHLNELSSGDFELLARSQKFHIVHCPRSHRYFSHTPFAVQRLRELGFNVCLGTDSLASNESLSLFAEMRALSENEPALSAREILEMATVNGATALSKEAEFGRVRSGFAADMIAVGAEYTDSGVYDELINFSAEVRWMMIEGESVESQA